MMLMVDEGRKVFRCLSLIADRVRVGEGRGGRGLGRGARTTGRRRDETRITREFDQGVQSSSRGRKEAIQSKDVSSSQKGPCAVCLMGGIFLS